ncbi:MAG: hypothetical protein HC905_09630, partial [Bacteroidales bacterium]|nr:hypothetical protein [Bacteroidales bacterium]
RAQCGNNLDRCYTGIEYSKQEKKGIQTSLAELTLRTLQEDLKLQFPTDLGIWLNESIGQLIPDNPETVSFSRLEQDYTQKFGTDFKVLWKSKSFTAIREAGLLAL